MAQLAAVPWRSISTGARLEKGLNTSNTERRPGLCLSRLCGAGKGEGGEYCLGRGGRRGPERDPVRV